MKDFDLSKYKACKEAVEFCDNYSTLREAWESCPRGDWMLWIAAKLKVEKRTLTLAKALCAKTVVHLMKDERSINAIKVAEAYGRGRVRVEELSDARAHARAYARAVDDAAYAAVYAATAYAAVYAAYAAVYAADDTVAGLEAAYAADAAAADAAYAAANQQQTADICREILTEEVFKLIK